MTVQKLASPVCQREDWRPLLAIEMRRDSHEPCRPQTVQVAVPEIGIPSVVVVQVAEGHGAKHANRRQRPYL